ncbi:hypothetical protein ACFWF6_11760 [Streptomyces goshikiensis]|uniref:hypothetical protein n=1 Tax=Streptomyces goshikiensis TaxID=1942 RepID=UPI00365435FB
MAQPAAPRPHHQPGQRSTHGPRRSGDEYDEATGTHLKGSVHGFISARLLDGVCGIAGTFSVLGDLARLLRHMLVPTQAAFDYTWIKESLRIHTGALTPARGLFWHPATGTDEIWVNYGFTGTGMWISPAQGRRAVLLTNKIRYNRNRELLTSIRHAFRVYAFASDQPNTVNDRDTDSAGQLPTPGPSSAPNTSRTEAFLAG